MEDMLTLHELIARVKEELLTPLHAGSVEELYPFLFVDEVELEVTVTAAAKVTANTKATLYVLEGSAGGEDAHGRGHTLRIKLSPLVTKEEMRARLKLDGRLWQGIERAADQGTVKDIEPRQG